MDLTPSGGHKNKRGIKLKEGKKMGKKGTERRAYTKEFKAEAAALAEKKEKPVGRIAADLGINENMLRRWAQASRESEGSGLRAFPGHGRPKDAELAR
jgi:transposase